MKAQRLKITEPGMETYSDYYFGVKFDNGLSEQPVNFADANTIGAFIRVEAVDDGAQVGSAVQYQKGKSNKAEVVTPIAVTAEQAAATSTNATRQRHTREELEDIADKHGIAGLREIADKYGVKGRGIVELITEILAAQG